MNRIRDAVEKLTQRLFGRTAAASHGHHAAQLEPDGPKFDFLCNLCGHQNNGILREQVANREFQSCMKCRSSLRMRSVIHVLSMELYGKSILLPNFPIDKKTKAIGMSDWTGYAEGLERAFSYTNTYYHTAPKLDITNIEDRMCGENRFLISSDVFEHIPVFSLDKAFENSRKLLAPGGVFVFTVPYEKAGDTREHFPNLYDFRIIQKEGRRELHNTTRDGKHEVFDNLIFHGGEGMTLEMRMFSESDLLRRLSVAGFSSSKIYADHVREYGIIWPMDWAVPIAARA